MKNEKGFSLVEFIIYITIFIILLTVTLRFYNSTVKVSNRIKNYNSLRVASRLIESVLYKEIYNAGCKSYIDSTQIHFEQLVYKSDSSSLLCKKGSIFDTLVLYKIRLNSKGIKEGVDSVKIFVSLDSSLCLSKNNKIIKTMIKVQSLKFEFGVQKDEIIKFSSDKWLSNGQINKNLDEYTFNNNSKGEIYYNDNFCIPETSTIIVRLSTIYKKNFPEGLDTFVCVLLNDKDTLAKEYFKPTGSEQNIELPLCKPSPKTKIFFKCKAHKGVLKINNVELIRRGKLIWSNSYKYAKAVKISIVTVSNNTILEIYKIIEIPNNYLL